MTDIERAKKILAADESFTLVIVRGDEIITSTERGVKPLMELVASGKNLKGASAADRIVGKAAALLYQKLGVIEVYACVLSSAGADALAAAGIRFSMGEKTPAIVNRRGDGPCPMEQAVAGVTTPDEAIVAIRDTIARLKAE